MPALALVPVLGLSFCLVLAGRSASHLCCFLTCLPRYSHPPGLHCPQGVARWYPWTVFLFAPTSLLCPAGDLPIAGGGELSRSSASGGVRVPWLTRGYCTCVGCIICSGEARRAAFGVMGPAGPGGIAWRKGTVTPGSGGAARLVFLGFSGSPSSLRLIPSQGQGPCIG